MARSSRGKRCWPVRNGPSTQQRIRLVLALDRYFPSLDPVGLGQGKLKHAGLVAGFGLVALHAHRQRDCALERTVRALDSMERPVLPLALILALTADRDRVFGDRHLYVSRFMPGSSARMMIASLVSSTSIEGAHTA
jgi:hypothetical protein